MQEGGGCRLACFLYRSLAVVSFHVMPSNSSLAAAANPRSNLG